MDVNLPVDQEFAIHAAAIAIQTLDRVELEEAFIELLHHKHWIGKCFMAL